MPESGPITPRSALVPHQVFDVAARRDRIAGCAEVMLPTAAQRTCGVERGLTGVEALGEFGQHLEGGADPLLGGVLSPLRANGHAADMRL